MHEKLVYACRLFVQIVLLVWFYASTLYLFVFLFVFFFVAMLVFLIF